MPTVSIWIYPLPNLVWISPGDFLQDAQEPTVVILLLVWRIILLFLLVGMTQQRIAIG